MGLEVCLRRCAETIHHIVTLCCQNSGRNPGGNLPAQIHTTSATQMCATAIYQPPKTLTTPKMGDFSAFLLLQLLTQIYFLIRVLIFHTWAKSELPSMSCETYNLKDAGISSILSSALWFLGFLSFSGMAITPKHLPINPWAPPGQFSQWHTLAEVPAQPPPVLENKRAFKLEHDSNQTFTCCWLNPAFSSDLFGQSVIYSLHTKKLKEWKKGHFFCLFYYMTWCTVFPGKKMSSFSSS